MPAPQQIDAVTFSDTTDFAELARGALLGQIGGATRDDAQPLDWVLRVYRALAGSPYAARLARGVASCLTAPEPEVRGQALVFFQTNAAAEGGDRICDLVAGDRALFRGVPDPIHPGTDLDWQLLAALAARLAIGDARARDLACIEVLHAGRAAPLIAELTDVARDWVVANAEAIVRGTPAAGATILIQLQGAVPDLVALARRIVPLCQGDARFELDVPRFIDDKAIGQQLVALFRAAAPSAG